MRDHLAQQIDENNRLTAATSSSRRLSERLKQQLDSKRTIMETAFNSASGFLNENLRLKEKGNNQMETINQLMLDKQALQKNNMELKNELLT